MKTVNAALTTALASDHAVEVSPVVIAEWNINSMFRTSVDNTPAEYDEGFDTNMFPIESITEQGRPEKSGIAKAIAGPALAAPTRYTTVPTKRFYAPSINDEYKYWQSPVVSAATPTGGSYAMTKTAPQVLYVEDLDVSGAPVAKRVWANKISFTVENAYATPVNYDVQVKVNVSDSWTTVSSNIAVPSTGKVELWYQGSNNWTTTKNYGNPLQMHAVRMVVNSMDKASSYFSLIELGLRLELDMTPDLVTVSSTANLADSDFITPLGTISSNTGSVSLFNENRTYSDKNTSSILYGMLDKGVEFTIGYNYTVAGSVYYVQDCVMYSDAWEDNDSETSVSLVDYSRFLQDVKPRRVLYRNMAITEIIWRLCDIVGFNNYNVANTTGTTLPVATIDFFWTDADKSLWETFSELSKATQTAIYFDSYNVLQIKPRDVAFQRDKTPVGLLTRDGQGSILPNITSLKDEKQYEANKVKINYRPAQLADVNYYVTPYEQVWEPEGDVVLRASELAADMTNVQDHAWVQPKDAATWPYKGMFNIQGEWVTYEGKEYQYRDQGVTKKGVVKSADDKTKFDETTFPNEKHMNGCTGKLMITERGSFNTAPAAHPLKPAGWRFHRIKGYSSAKIASGLYFQKNESCAQIVTGTTTTNDYVYLNRGLRAGPQPKLFGTSIRIDKSNHAHKIGGLFFAADNSGSGGLGAGYYVEVAASVTFVGKKRSTSNEVAVYSMKADGSKKVFGGQELVVKDKSKDKKGNVVNTITKSNIGARAAIVQGYYNDLDVVFSQGTDHTISVYLNGTLLIEATVPNGSGWQHASSGVWGLYARGATQVSYDYAYAIIDPGGINPATGAQYLDRITGGYRSNFAMLDIVYGSRYVKPNPKKNKKILQKYETRFFDEFGPILHEMRDFDVKYSVNEPVVGSKLYLSNLSQTVPLNFAADNGSARFTLVNTSRSNAVLSGDDELTTSGQGTINQKLFVYGRPVKITEDQSIEKRDDVAIRRRGEIETEYDSPWVQSEGEATALANWLINNFRTTDSVLTVEAFGNLTYELGDVLTVDYLDIQGTYYVTEISNNFDAGVVTNLVLRKT